MDKLDATLVDIVFINGKLCKAIEHTDGTKEYVPVKSEESSFQDTETIPCDWKPTTTEVLERHTPLTKDEHIDRSCRIEAILVKAFSPRMGESNSYLDTRGNTALKELLKDLCRAMGGEWEEKSNKIK